MKLNRFNKIAGIYDSLTRVVFGKSLYNAQVFFLNTIPPNSNVLILGGGTGWLLEALLDINPSCRVWYVEASSSMISHAEKTIGKAQSNRVYFIHGTEADIPPGMMYDAVVTHFFLDLFSASSLNAVITTIQGRLKPDAVWLVSDFVYRDKRWQKILLRLMYLFFRLTCRIETVQLPPWEEMLARHGFDEAKSENFFGSFIRSVLLKRRRDH
jgi:tRNA (cmo5U34)-methyltransferase